MIAYHFVTPSFLALALCGCNAFETTGSIGDHGDNTHKVIDLVVSGGQPTKVDWFYSTNLDCTEIPGASGRVAVQPQHGEVVIEHKPDYPKFAPDNPHSQCNDRPVPSWVITYVPARGFVGHDIFWLDESFAEGPTVNVDVNVDVQK